MREVEYPFDSQLLIRKRRGIKRQLLKDGNKRIQKRIAILGGSTTNDVADMLELFLLGHGIEPIFYQSEYGKYWEDSVFGNDKLNVFGPDIIYIHTTNRNILKYPSIGDTASVVEAMLQEEYKRFEAMWDILADKYHCPIIQNNFELPDARDVGNMSAYAVWGSVNYITRLNLMFYEYASSHTDFFINDINYQASCYGLHNWHDQFCWFMYKYALSLNAIPTLAFNLANIIKSIYGKNKKALAIDLDNTLWGGVVGDDGVECLAIGNETSRGQIYVAFQQYLKRLKQSGVLLNIISKNEDENAKAGLNHPGMFLKPDDFITIVANWKPKSENLLRMSEDLSLGSDSFVFVDDNPAEREIVRQQIPGAGVPELEKAEDFIRAVDEGGYFEMTAFSADDAKRNEMYRENAQRISLRNSFADYGEYLKSLEMIAEIRAFESVYIDRIAQLTNKSNQFNLTTKRYSHAEIEQIAQSDEYIKLYGRLIDKFGDNGIVTVVIGKKNGKELNIILWLMSCRVLKRDMEFAMMDSLVKRCAECGIQTLRGFYYPTAKNGMVRDFYQIQGFDKVSEDPEGNSEWCLQVEGYKNKNHVIEVKEI